MARDRSGRAGEHPGDQIELEWLVAPGSRNGTSAVRGDYPPPLPSPADGEGETDWSLLTFLLSIEGEPPVVALGCPLEALSAALTKTHAPIIAVDPHPGQAPHPESWGAEDGVANVSRVRGRPSGGLPFRDSSVGQVIVHQAAPPARWWHGAEPGPIQPGFLREARRILKADGILWLVVNQRGCRLSPARLRASLIRCGFSASDSYMTLPGHRRFTALAPIASGRRMRSCIDFCLEGNAFRERRLRAWLKMLATAGLLQYVAPEYIVLGRKER